jgi:regulator of protease activity HflC (stomatin/prohibitin superfamily)
MDFLVPALSIVFVVVVAAAVIRVLFDFVTIHDYERGLRYSRGRFAGLLNAGGHVVFRPLGEIRVLDGRPVVTSIEGQEVLTADGVNVKVSLATRHVIDDPVTAVTSDQDYRRAFYVTVQLGLREAVAGRTADELLAARTEIGRTVFELTASRIASLGLELLSVEVRDLMLPAELKRAFAGVVAARKSGEAALERARGETAALRNLANAAGVLEQHPGLLQIRALQEVGGSSGNTIMLGLADGVGPPAAKRRAPDKEPAAGA